jgi:hypothetical protein
MLTWHWAHVVGYVIVVGYARVVSLLLIHAYLKDHSHYFCYSQTHLKSIHLLN